jgi:hypothetical protein
MNLLAQKPMRVLMSAVQVIRHGSTRREPVQDESGSDNSQ